MKIQGRKSQQIGIIGPINVSTPQETAPAQQSSNASDSVEISSSPQLRKLNEMVQAMPSVRADKVEELRDAIEEGNYHVESEKLARKVVDDVLTEGLLQKLEGRDKP